MKWFKKKKQRTDNAIPQNQAREFRDTMCNIKSHIEFVQGHPKRYVREDADTHILLLCDFLIELFVEELKVDANIGMFRCAPTEAKDWRYVLSPFVDLFLKCKLHADYTEVSSEGKTLITSIYDSGKLIPALGHIFRNGFRSDMDNYTGHYFPDLNLILVTNGLHHSCAAQYLKAPGTFKAHHYPFDRIFDSVTTDGEFWYISNEPDYKLAVGDVRMAILYELVRIKRQYQNQ